jgi:asparagine synthase (glutamine-hydrolysing)
MCGIFAWVGPGIDETRLLRCVDLQRHRGPDERRHWTDGVAWLGHNRLKIIDLSAAGAQPMFNEDGTIAVIFNGEIYNFPELREELLSRGHRFCSRCDTEVIVHAYEEYGEQFVERLWGMFALAIWDQPKKRMLLARDRFGKKPLYYALRGENLVLASELPAILESGLSDRTADLDALAFFWQLEYIPAPFTAFADIKKLPAAHAMIFESGKTRIWRYYPPSEVSPFRGTYAQAKDQLADLVTDATRRRLVSDVPVGVALSGGIDSATIVAAARRITSGPLVTVTVRPHIENSEHDEGDFARATAKALGTDHHEIRPIPDFRESFETIIAHLGEPFAIGSAVPSYYLFSELRSMATVVITGDGGDELFAGYDYYRQIDLVNFARKVFPDFALSAMYGGINTAYGMSDALRPKLKQVLAGIQFVRGQPTTDAHWEQQRALRPEILRRWRDQSGIGALQKEIEGYFSETDPMRLRMLSEQFIRMTYHILTKVDITSMAHSVEVRSPLLDHRIAEFARSLPNNFLVGNGVGKRILRDLGADVLPPEVVGKRKTGFTIPIRDLFANELKNYLMEILTSPHPVYDALVNRDRIPEIMEAHCAGRPFETLLLLKLLALRLWIEKTGPRLPA